MSRNYLLLCLFGISARFLADTVAHEAIIGGTPVSDNYISYQVSVQLRGHGHVCGGGIIGNEFVLTAAHCVLNHNRHLRSNHISILAGTNGLNRTDPPAITVRVENVFFPREFHPTVDFSYGDIAILMLAGSFKLEYHANLGKLELPRNNHIDAFAFIAGFGWYEMIRNEGVGRTDGHLRSAAATVILSDICERVYPSGAIQSEIHLCARGYYASVCSGDAGGPLVQSGNTVIGIVSKFPAHCDEREHPTIYTRVTHYVRMILNVMDYGHDPHMISMRT